MTMVMMTTANELELDWVQGEMVDRIEYHVEQGREDVAQAHQELVKAKEYQSKARKVLLHKRVTQQMTIVVLDAPGRRKEIQFQ